MVNLKVLTVALVASVDARRYYDSNRVGTRLAIPSDGETEHFASNGNDLDTHKHKSPLVGTDTIGTDCPDLCLFKDPTT
jgi:hypothetical protein